MKATKYLCLVCLLTLFACKKNEIIETDIVEEVETVLSFTASIKAQEEVDSRLTTNNSWVGISDNSIGVKIGDVVKKYSVSEVGNMTSETPFYWNEFSSSTVMVNAWYPYNDGVKPEVVVSADQSVIENFHNSDFLECEMEVSQENTALVFTHAGAKIICNVKLDSDVDASLNGSKVLLYNIAGVDEGTTIVTSASHEALVAPQVIPAGTVFVGVELNDGRYAEIKEGALLSDLVIEKGYCYKLDITVNPTTVDIVSQGPVSWGGSSVDTGSDPEEENPGEDDDDTEQPGDDWEQSGDDSDVDGEVGTVNPGSGTNTDWSGNDSDVSGDSSTVDPDNGNDPGWSGSESGVQGDSSTVDPDGNESGWSGEESDVDGGPGTFNPEGNSSTWDGSSSDVNATTTKDEKSDSTNSSSNEGQTNK